MKPTQFHKLLAGHLLQTLAAAQTEGEKLTLDDLVERVKARRVDVRTVVSMLHTEGYLDAIKMRLTMRGFVVGSSLANVTLRPLRQPVKLRLVQAA